MNAETAQRRLQLLAELRQRHTASATELAAALGISQPTLSRLTRATPGVIAMGRARATRYALAHEIGREGSRWPLYRLDARAQAQRLGQLQALHGGGFYLQADTALPAFTHGDYALGTHAAHYPGLPWFLDDQRPQGFLGRAFAQRVAPLIGAHPDLLQWPPDDTVLALLRFGFDPPGDLILGDAALAQAMAAVLDPPDVIDIDAVAAAYVERAEAALRGEIIGSSAAGEQPKFTATLRQADGRLLPVIVKFSERGHSPAAQRWADLLHCEHLASEVLREHHLPAAHSRIVQGDGRVFLQSTRFDRSPEGGRHGFVSLAALDAAYYGHGRIDWWAFAAQLEHDGWLDSEDATRLATLGWFGALIGNSDMHLGNAGLILTEQRPLALAPSYDMLPMLWRPSAHGEVVARDFQPPLPSPAQHAHWRLAAQMALDFWRRSAEWGVLSEDFRPIAKHALARIERAIAAFG